MNIPSGADVDDATRETLASLAVGDPDLLAEGLEVRAEWCAKSGLDERSYALVKLAALTALDAGATPEDLVGVLIAIAPQVGGPKLVAAAPELMVALGLALPEGT